MLASYELTAPLINDDVVEMRRILAEALFNQGKVREAETEYRKLLSYEEKKLSDGANDIYFTWEGIAKCLKAQGRLNEALDFAKRAEKG